MGLLLRFHVGGVRDCSVLTGQGLDAAVEAEQEAGHNNGSLVLADQHDMSNNLIS